MLFYLPTKLSINFEICKKIARELKEIAREKRELSHLSQSQLSQLFLQNMGFLRLRFISKIFILLYIYNIYYKIPLKEIAQKIG